MPQLALTLDLDGLDAESVEQACFDAGALSVSYTDQRDDPILEPAPGEFRLWPASRLQALFDAGDASPELLHHLCANLGIDAARVKVAHLPDRAWEREWLKDFRPMRFGRRLWICPSHEQVEEAGAIVVKLDPGLAFGTGTHPTTRLCLEWLESQLRRDATLIDYGCGSGVLAIAALKLGAPCGRVRHRSAGAHRDARQCRRERGRRRAAGLRTRRVAAAAVTSSSPTSSPLCELAPRFAELVPRRPAHACRLTTQMPELIVAASRWFELAEAPPRRLGGPRRSPQGAGFVRMSAVTVAHRNADAARDRAVTPA
ncbi:MAG: 50S ribosomal protein L11 methyltransferase [Steroidobacteraceae bacterium]